MLETLKIKSHRLLRWSEKYTKTDMVYMAKGGFWLTISQIISSICSLLLVIAFANLISPELYGKYRYALSIFGILAIATFPGMSTVAIKSVAMGDDGAFWKLVRKRALWSLTSTVASLGVALYYILNDNQELSLVLVIAAIALPLSSIVGMYSSYLNGMKDFRRLAYWSTLVRIVMTIALVVSLPWVNNLPLLFLFYFIPEIIMEALFLGALYRQKRIATVTVNAEDYSRFGFHVSLMEILKTVSSHIDKILVFHYLGAVQLAVYTIATSAPGQIKSVLQNITTLAIPKFSSATESDIRKTLPTKLLKLEIAIIGCIIVYWIVAPYIFPLVFPAYTEAVFISQIFSLSLIFFPRTFLSTAMAAHMKQGALYAIRTITPIIRILIFLIALPLFGIWGAVVGSIIANAFTAFIYHYFFRRAFSSGTTPSSSDHLT